MVRELRAKHQTLWAVAVIVGVTIVMNVVLAIFGLSVYIEWL